METTIERRGRIRTLAALPSGGTSANTWEIPRRAATLRAADQLSPVTK